jgi:7-carboxy-7-deazaguanine synthase
MNENEAAALLKNGEVLPLMEAFYTLQGEGFHTGKAAYFLRIGGCDVGCHWCDVKESWNPKLFAPTPIEDIVCKPDDTPAKTVVITGGEPLMYNMNPLCNRLIDKGYELHLETSGAYPLSGKWNWICLSPKRNMPPLNKIFAVADELKVIIENENDLLWAEDNAELVGGNCKLFLQPEWSKIKLMMPKIINYIMANPKWSISLQSHKYMNIP